MLLDVCGADDIVSRAEINSHIHADLLLKINTKFLIAAFDSTYSCNGLTSYTEGLAFARDIVRLADTVKDVCILWREKKKRSIHVILDACLGPQLLALYKEMDHHPRIINVTETLGSGQMISLSDLTVSFPYTSTTFEGLSAGRRAVWHDALGRYSNSNFLPKFSCTHSFAELLVIIKQIQQFPQFVKKQLSDLYEDPYQDHGAVNRFRQLLTTSNLSLPQ